MHSFDDFEMNINVIMAGNKGDYYVCAHSVLIFSVERRTSDEFGWWSRNFSLPWHGGRYELYPESRMRE